MSKVKEQVPSRCWYYLLDFNEADEWKTLIEITDGKNRLHDVTLSEFWELFKIATASDLKEIGKSCQKTIV